MTTHPEHDEERDERGEILHRLSELRCFDAAKLDGVPTLAVPSLDAAHAIADFILAHTAKAVEEAREQAWLAGYEAGRNTGMEDKEKIAQWLETLHCDRIGCWKERCLLFRDLAEQIRNGEWDAKNK